MHNRVGEISHAKSKQLKDECILNNWTLVVAKIAAAATSAKGQKSLLVGRKRLEINLCHQGNE